MNPFDLQGPQFLVLYVLLGAVLIGGIWYMRQAPQKDQERPVTLTDPYEIAYLRGGADEMLRLVTMSLIDRGLLEMRGTALKTVADMQRLRHPLERVLLEGFRTESAVAPVFKSKAVREQCAQYDRSLAASGAWLDDRAHSLDRLYRIIAAAALLLVAAVKLVVALSRGRSNVGLLIVFAIAFTMLTRVVMNHRRTPGGERFLQHMRTLLRSLRERAASLMPDANGDEFVMLGAVYGVSALPGKESIRSLLFPNAGRDGSSCGSSCGSGGSGCGGGGCGGGCGGCGS